MHSSPSFLRRGRKGLKRMFTVNRVLGSALCLLGLLGGQALRADETPVHLIVTPKVGRVLRTRLATTITIMGMELQTNGTVKNVIKEVKPNGDVVIETIDEGGTITVNGQKAPQNATPPYTSTRDKFGKTIETHKTRTGGVTTPEVNKLLDAITDIILTDKPVKLNDTWVTEVENPVVKEKKVIVKDTYVGTEKIEGKEYWKLKQTAEATTDAAGNRIVYEVTEWISSIDGAPFKFEATVANVPTRAGLMSLKLRSDAIPVEEKDTPPPAKKSD